MYIWAMPWWPVIRSRKAPAMSAPGSLAARIRARSRSRIEHRLGLFQRLRDAVTGKRDLLGEALTRHGQARLFQRALPDQRERNSDYCHQQWNREQHAAR